MKKYYLIIFSIIITFCLCGCKSHQENEYSEGAYYIGKRFTIFTDDETCVEYFVSNGSYNIGNVMPRYNQNGTIKLNKQCLEEKGLK